MVKAPEQKKTKLNTRGAEKFWPEAYTGDHVDRRASEFLGDLRQKGSLKESKGRATGKARVEESPKQKGKTSLSTCAQELDTLRGCEPVRDGLSSWRDVKSIPPTTENWLRKRYIYNMNNDTSTEDKHETNHINKKCNDMNTRKMHIT